jgi:predicted dehydrogenase
MGARGFGTGDRVGEGWLGQCRLMTAEATVQKPSLHRVGIIGTGGIARTHLLGYQAAGVNVAALCDVNESTLTDRQTEWGIADGFTDYRELLADPTITAVSICTPNSSHHAITIAAAHAGKHVLCEKPVSMSLMHADEMINACATAGVVFQVGHHMRSWAAANHAKAMIDRGDLGEVAYLRLRQTHDWGGAREVRGVFGSKELSGGGTLLDNGCHLFDLARYLGGDVNDVFARMTTRKFAIEVEDTATSSLGFRNGAVGNVEVAWTATGWQEAFWVFGTEGSLECDNRVAANVVTHRYRGSAAQTWADTDVTRFELQGLEAHSQHVVNFLASIEGSRPVVCSGVDGREAVRLVLASYESAMTGAVVRLPA